MAPSSEGHMLRMGRSRPTCRSPVRTQLIVELCYEVREKKKKKLIKKKKKKKKRGGEDVLDRNTENWLGGYMKSESCCRGGLELPSQDDCRACRHSLAPTASSSWNRLELRVRRDRGQQPGSACSSGVWRAALSRRSKFHVACSMSSRHWKASKRTSPTLWLNGQIAGGQEPQRADQVSFRDRKDHQGP